MAETQNVREIDPTALFKQVVPQFFFMLQAFFLASNYLNMLQNMLWRGPFYIGIIFVK